MALTAFPDVRFNAASGSDTAASGAGPATAVVGTCNASTNSTTVTFAGAPDLSGVAQDGSHVLWVSGVGFVRISTTDNVAKSVVVETAITVVGGAAFAIGGKRATFGNTESARLFAGASAPTTVAASGGWTITTETDQTSATTLTINAQTTSTQPPLVIRGDQPWRQVVCSGASQAVIATTQNGAGNYRYSNLQIRHSHATTRGVGINFGNGTYYLEVLNCIIGAADGTDCPTTGINRAGGSIQVAFINSSALRCSSFGLSVQTLHIIGSEVSRCGSGGITGFTTLTVVKSIIAHNAGTGLFSTLVTGGGNAVFISDTTIHGNSGDGIGSSGINLMFLKIFNNQITGNGGYGINLTGTGPHYAFVECNNFGNASDSTANTSGSVNGIALPPSNTTAAPGYADPSAAVRNFATAPSAQGGGFPTGPIGQSATLTYLDKGASQHPNPANGFVIGG